MTSPPDPTPKPPPLDSRSAFHAGVGWAVAEAMRRGARRMIWIDPHFHDWPLDDPALIDALTGWLRLPQRRLTLLASAWGEMALRHARFCGWRREWSHALETRTPSPDEAPSLPTLLLDDTGVMLRLIDPVHWRGRVGVDVHEGRLAMHEYDALAQRSEPDFPVTQLGL